jgi:hypothetical protein
MAGLLLLVLSSALLILLYHFQANTQFAAVLALLLGFSAVSAVRLLQPRPSNEPRRIIFNENALLAQLSVVISNVMPNTIREHRQLSWDIQAHDLVGRDNALALAKVRLDLERELLRLIDETNTPSPSTASIRSYARSLVDAHVVPPGMLSALLEVSHSASAAIHGETLSTDVVIGVVRVGEELVEILRALPTAAA